LAVRETIGATVRAWVEEITAEELRSDEVRHELRPMLAELVRQEVAAALVSAKRNGHRRK
jgi:hypothetical protein